ncbi:MAG: TIGR02266 family protein [Myxococcales bacterium]|nr:TIGR02266 family protein [Myxococcales bacterium]
MSKAKKKNGAEQRTERRSAFDIKIGVATRHQLFVGLSANISSGGLFVATDQELKRGDAIEVRFSIPGSEHVFQKKAEVAWTRPFDQNHSDRQAQAGAGVRLLDLTNDEKQMLNAFIQAHDPMFFDV